jgi:hypothetical protein
MKNIYIIVILIVVVRILQLFMYPEKESFLGAITQLQAKGLQDLHLTVNNEKYLGDYYYRYPYIKYPLSHYYWNVPTRYRRPYYYYYDGHRVFPYLYK